MKVLTQNLKNGETKIIDVPSPGKDKDKIKVLNKYSLISTGTESYIVNFGRAGWINKARQQPQRVKDVINKIKSSGISETLRAIKIKLDYPMVMGYSSVGSVIYADEKYSLSNGARVFTNSVHQEEALVDYNMCVEIPENVSDKSASFGAIGGIALQSIKCIPKNSHTIALIGLGLLGQVTLRILKSMGYKCFAYDIDFSKIELAEKHGAVGIRSNDIVEFIQNHTKGLGVDCTIIAASSLSNEIVNDATSYTKRKGKIISSGLVGLNLIRDKFFKKQIELVISNSSGDKNHKGEGSSYENISYFFDLLLSEKIYVDDLISEEVSFDYPENIYSFPTKSLFFSKLIRYDVENINNSDTFIDDKSIINSDKIKSGIIGSGNFSLSTLLPNINKSKYGYVSSILGREGLPLYVAKKRYKIPKVTTSYKKFFDNIDSVFVCTPHETHYSLFKKSLDLSIHTWIEKPLVITSNELISIRSQMLSKKLVYAVGYNRSFSPWTKFAKKTIDGKKSDIKMTINAGKLPSEHWLLNKSKCGGRILGECCHFIDLSLTLLTHTKLKKVECIERDYHFQDTGKYILSFEDGSTVSINYTHKLPPSLPKEKISIELTDRKLVNNNWRKFSSDKIFDFNFIKKGKGHKEAINEFFDRIKSDKYLSKSEINAISFSTFVSIKLQAMRFGESLDFSNLFDDEILSNQLDL